MNNFILLDFTLILGCLVLFKELINLHQSIPYPLLFDIKICIRFSRYISLTVLPVIITHNSLCAIITGKPLGIFFKMSGDGEIRTLDPLLARQVLSQLSYTPR